MLTHNTATAAGPTSKRSCDRITGPVYPTFPFNLDSTMAAVEGGGSAAHPRPVNYKDAPSRTSVRPRRTCAPKSRTSATEERRFREAALSGPAEAAGRPIALSLPISGDSQGTIRLVTPLGPSDEPVD
jgi:hypothetical protein